MARGRNRNNQGANHKNQGSNHPENIDDATDAEFLENDDQVDSELSDEEEQATMANEPSPQDDNEIDESEADTVAASNDVAKKKGNNAVWYGVGAVLVAAAVAGVYYSNQSDDSANNPSVTSQVAEVETAPTDESALTEPEEPVTTPEDSESSANPEDTATSSTATDDSTESVGLASSDDVIEHHTSQETAEEKQESEVSPATATDEDSTSAEERPAELSAIVSPEVGIGAFEQEELATGVQTPEDATSMDEPNSEKVEASDIEVSSNTADTAVDASSEEEVAPIQDDAEPSESVSESQEQEQQQQPAESTEDAQAQVEAHAHAEAIAAVEEQGSKVIEELEREFELLTARQQQEIRRLQGELAGMQQHLKANNESVDGLLLNDVSRLLQSAENELRFNGNVANAVSILTVAQRIAAESKNTMLQGLVGAIGADIVSLKSSESATIEDMFRQVQQLSRLIDAAPLNTPDYASHTDLMLPSEVTADTPMVKNVATPQDAEVAATAADAKWYERTWNQTKSLANTTYEAIASDLGDLVRVEKLSEPDSGLLSAEQAGIMRNNLKMQLGFAQQALMSRQQGIWQTSLMTVADAVGQYFRPEAAETKQAQAMLAELLKSSVQPAMPDISHSHRALSETYEQLRVQRSFQE